MYDLISIIIPVYNVEEYLNQCLDSIINQSYNNLEIIIIDDGSTDNSSKICDEFAIKDNRIKVIHKSNGGLSDARNIGIENSNGKYIFFVDSDDFIDNIMIEKLYKLIKANDADISMCNFTYYYNDDLKHELIESPVKNDILNRQEAIDKLFEEKNWFYVVAWNKLYKKEIWDDIKFPKGYIHEDEAVIHKVFMKCNKIVTTSESLYFYRQVKGSIMNSGFNEKRLDKYYALSDRIVFLKDIVTNHQLRILCYQYWYNFFNDFYKVYNTNPKSIYLNRMRKSLIKVINIFVKIHFFTLKDLISVLIFLINADLYKILFLKKGEDKNG